MFPCLCRIGRLLTVRRKTRLWSSLIACPTVEPVNLLHGTSAHLRDVIEREGLREPFAGRGVSLCRQHDGGTAGAAARSACLRHRAATGGQDSIVVALAVVVNVAGLEGIVCPPRTLDRTETVIVRHVPPERIVECHEIELIVSPAGSLRDALERGLSGMGRTTESIAALPSWDRAQSAWGLVPEILGVNGNGTGSIAA